MLVKVGVTSGVFVRVMLEVGVRDRVAVKVEVPLRVLVKVGVVIGVDVRENVEVGVRVRVAVKVEVGFNGVGVRVRVIVGVRVRVAVKVGVPTHPPAEVASMSAFTVTPNQLEGV